MYILLWTDVNGLLECLTPVLEPSSDLAIITQLAYRAVQGTWDRILSLLSFSQLNNLRIVRGLVDKLVVRLLARAALWVRIQTSLKNTKWVTYAKERPIYYSPPKNIQKKLRIVQLESESLFV